MKITQVMLSAGFGGGERLFVDMCLEMAALGHQVQAVCHPNFQERRQIIQPGITISPLLVRWDWSPWARFRLTKMLKQFAPEVIHSHLSRGAALAGSVGDSLGIPVLANIHNYVKLKYYRQVNHFCPSTADQMRYLASKGVEPDRITVIPHFSRIPNVDALESPLSIHKPPTFLSYGRFVAKKGFHHLIEGIARLRQTGVDAKLLLGGDGPERPTLKRLIDDLDLADHVHLSGWIEDVASFLSQSPYVVIPSLDEPFGIVVLEAMARGKVIVCSRTQGPMETLNDETAFLFETGNVDDLIRAMNDALVDLKRSQKKALAALSTYGTQFSPKVIIPRYVALLESLQSTRGNG